MTTGKVLQFDRDRGYGFVAADDGGEDIFLHASVFNGDPSELVPGVALELQIAASDRGRKALAARFADDHPTTAEQSVLPAQRFSSIDEQMCDVLSQAEFIAEITELLLNTAPELTAQQILQARQGMLEFARKQGWIDA